MTLSPAWVRVSSGAGVASLPVLPPVGAGSLSRTAINYQAGALTRFSGVFTGVIERVYGANYDLTLALDHAIPTPIPGIVAVWAVEGALLAGIITVFAFAWPQLSNTFAEGSKLAVGGA